MSLFYHQIMSTPYLSIVYLHSLLIFTATLTWVVTQFIPRSFLPEVMQEFLVSTTQYSLLFQIIACIKASIILRNLMVSWYHLPIKCNPKYKYSHFKNTKSQLLSLFLIIDSPSTGSFLESQMFPVQAFIIDRIIPMKLSPTNT